MLDTIAIYSKEYSHSGLFPEGFEIKQTIKADTGEISGSKYVYNSDVLNLTDTKNTLYIHFSLPKLYGLESNFYALGAGSCKAVAGTLQSYLKSFGYSLDLKSFKVGRLDIFKNISLEYDFIDYLTVFAHLNFKRTHSREYIDGFLYANSLRELCFYNKTKELLDKGGVLPDGVQFNKVMRGELRFLNHKEVKKYGLDEFEALPDKWEHIKETYKEQLQNVFSAKFKKGDELVNTKVMLLQEKGFDKAIKIFGLLGLSEIPKETLRVLLLEQLPKRTAYDYLKRIDEVKMLYGQLSENKELFEELKEKFLE